MNYPFICKECNHYFEKSLSIADYGIYVVCCPKCQSNNVRRTYQPITIIYNGDGFTKFVKEE